MGTTRKKSKQTMALEIGTRLGHYNVTVLIGGGGIFRAPPGRGRRNGSAADGR